MNMNNEQAAFVLECVEAHGLANDARLHAINVLKDNTISIDKAIDIVHLNFLKAFDSCIDGEPIIETDKLLLSLNKSICNDLWKNKQ